MFKLWWNWMGEISYWWKGEMSSLSSIRAGERVGGMKMTRVCIYCGIKENDGHPDDRNDFVCDRCRGIVRNFYKDIEHWEKDTHYREQTEIRCCFNCAHSWFQPDGDLWCRLGPGSKILEKKTNVHYLGICDKYEPMEE